MLIKKVLVFSIGIAIAALTGCGQAMVKHEYQQVYINPNIADRAQHVERSIVQACFDKRWTPGNPADGEVTCSINVRGEHQITVLIGYDDNGFSISPVSTNMDTMFGGVHGKYNEWVTRLHSQIVKRIGRR